MVDNNSSILTECHGCYASAGFVKVGATIEMFTGGIVGRATAATITKCQGPEDSKIVSTVGDHYVYHGYKGKICGQNNGSTVT